MSFTLMARELTSMSQSNVIFRLQKVIDYKCVWGFQINILYKKKKFHDCFYFWLKYRFDPYFYCFYSIWSSFSLYPYFR